APRADGFHDDIGVRPDALSLVVTGEIHGERLVAPLLEQRHDAVPVPGYAAGAWDEDKVGHGCKVRHRHDRPPTRFDNTKAGVSNSSIAVRRICMRRDAMKTMTRRSALGFLGGAVLAGCAGKQRAAGARAVDSGTPSRVRGALEGLVTSGEVPC